MRTTTVHPSNHPDHRLRRVIAAGAISLLACGALGACSASSPSAKTGDKASTTTARSTTTDAMSATTTAPNGSGSTGGTGGNSQSNGGQTNGGSGTSHNGPAPTIVSFTTPDNIDCHNGNLQNFSASWTTQNATNVTISIDGAGIYDTYGPNSDTSLPFNCSSSHTFLLTAFSADGQTTTKTITLQPRNVQQPSSPDDEPTS